MRSISQFIVIAAGFSIIACQSADSNTVQPASTDSVSIIKPVVITEPVQYDTDDPAIWLNPLDPAASLVLGTDKETDGALYVFDLQGKIIKDKVVRGLKRPNNVDVEYGLILKGKLTDIAVVTERLTHKLRIYSLPDMKAIDSGGIEVFAGESGLEYRSLMGIGLYKDSAGQIFAIVGRKSGPQDGTYLWQYLLHDNGSGIVKAKLVRKFGKFSGRKEIEAIAVDDALGYVYYSDEGFGIRKYYADPNKGNAEITVFGDTDFTQDQEGISIYNLTDTTGYILISDQQSDQFYIYPREGEKNKPHYHPLVKKVRLSTMESDGSDVISVPLNNVFKKGLFVAMSTDRSFHFYKWEDIIK